MFEIFNYILRLRCMTPFSFNDFFFCSSAQFRLAQLSSIQWEFVSQHEFRIHHDLYYTDKSFMA